MISKQEFLDSILKETRIIRHLYSKLPEGGLDYRPTPQQRSTLELLQYLSHFAGIEAAAIKQGQALNFESSMQEAYRMPVENFLSEMDKQDQAIIDVFNSLSEADMEKQADLFGRGQSRPIKVWLMETMFKSLVGYKMQFFLYLKACGISEISTPNLWRGEDAVKK